MLQATPSPPNRDLGAPPGESAALDCCCPGCGPWISGESAAFLAAAPGPFFKVPSTSSSRTAPTEQYIPPNPETPHAYATHSNFGFPRFPKTQRPKGAKSRIRMWGFWGFGATGKSPPPVVALTAVKIPTRMGCISPVVRGHRGPSLPFATDVCRRMARKARDRMTFL